MKRKWNSIDIHHIIWSALGVSDRSIAASWMCLCNHKTHKKIDR